MSKVFDAVTQAELAVAKRKKSEAAPASVSEDRTAQTGGSGRASAPNLVAQSTSTSAPSSQQQILHHNAKAGGFVKVLAAMISRAWSWRRATPEVPRPSFVFGDFGVSLESAEQSPFWQWFHMEQTREQTGMRRFQPNGPQFHSLCYLDVACSAKKELQALTLGLQRSFINGTSEPFARDLVRCFLCAAFPEQKSAPLSHLVHELGTEFGAPRPATAEELRRSGPSSLYLVFVGHGQRGAVQSDAFLLEMENLSVGATRWFCLRVRPLPAFQK